MWCVQCSDPGIINRSQDISKLPFLTEQERKIQESGVNEINVEDDVLSLNSFEEQAIRLKTSNDDEDKSLIYREARFYQYRECSTCAIQRLPKANHCSICNNCVKGFDHHCTLLNNCVGKRTLRVFIILLMCSWVFYLVSGVIAAIAILYEPYYQEYKEDGHIEFNNFQLYENCIIFFLQLIKFIFLCCARQCVTFGQAIIWIILEAIICLGLAIVSLNGKIITAAPMLSLGLSFMLVVWPLLSKHLNFIQHHLTEKEFHARLEVMNRLQVEDAHLKSIGCCQKLKNLYKFFCCRKIPKSEIL